ncbi:hypothetical protein Tco_1542517, partial [Tanacetum coccineum]
MGCINDAPLNPESRNDAGSSMYFADHQMGCINDAPLNPESRNDAGSSMSPKLKKRVIKVRSGLNVNIAGDRDQKTPKSIFSPSGRKRKAHNLDHGNGMTLGRGTQCNFGKALSIALRRGTQYVWILIKVPVADESVKAPVVKESVKMPSSVVADKLSSVVADKVDVVKDNINVVADKVVKENLLSVLADV